MNGFPAKEGAMEVNETHADVLVAGRSEEEERAERLSELHARLFGDLELPNTLPRRTLRRVLADAVRRVWYGPPPENLTIDELKWIMRPRDDEDDGLPERVPPDDPHRLAWEAELRAAGITPAKKWSFPDHTPRPRFTFRERIQERFRRGL
jgi:hypothetical protein